MRLTINRSPHEHRIYLVAGPPKRGRLAGRPGRGAQLHLGVGCRPAPLAHPSTYCLMSQAQKQLEPADRTLGMLLLYLLLVLGPILLKLAGFTRIATWSWWKVTAMLWLPWGLLLVVSLLGWLLHLVGRRRP